IGLPREAFEEGLNPEVREAVLAAARRLEASGAIVEWMDLPLLRYAVPAYYIIASAEAASNLSRYDGLRYGHSVREAGISSEAAARALAGRSSAG
ncbi:MAG TPA: amidase family protein, partial [Clostridia bacterium]|nr:amidase family protein [Clostridia bacterium]